MYASNRILKMHITDKSLIFSQQDTKITPNTKGTSFLFCSLIGKQNSLTQDLTLNSFAWGANATWSKDHKQQAAISKVWNKIYWIEPPSILWAPLPVLPLTWKPKLDALLYNYFEAYNILLDLHSFHASRACSLGSRFPHHLLKKGKTRFQDKTAQSHPAFQDFFADNYATIIEFPCLMLILIQTQAVPMYKAKITYSKRIRQKVPE
jgi:hypothetical protein